MSTAGLSGDLDPSSGAAQPFSEQDDRPAGEQVGHLLRLDVVDVEAAECHVDAGEHRGVDIAPQARSGRGRLSGFRDDEWLAESGPGDPLDEKPVHAAADAEREEIDVVQVAADVVEDVRL